MKSSKWKVPRAIIYLHNNWPNHIFITSAVTRTRYSLFNLVKCKDLAKWDKDISSPIILILEKENPEHIEMTITLPSNQLFALIGDQDSDHAVLLFKKTENSFDLICNTYSDLSL